MGNSSGSSSGGAGHDQNTKDKTTNAGADTSPALVLFMKKNPVFTTIVISLVVVAGVYFWQDFQARREQSRIIESASSYIEQSNQEMLRLISRPLVWSIRAELLRDNHEQIGLLISDLVKEKYFLSIFVVNPEGEIIISTNKRQEGSQASEHVSNQLLTADDTTLLMGENHILTLAAPVMGFDKRIGTLVIEYLPEEFELPAK